MMSIFSEAVAFNKDFGGWDTSHAMGLYGMFSMAAAFSQDVGCCDTPHVTSTGHMF